MSAPIAAPYGAWKSPITSERIVSASIGLGSPQLDGDDIYWLEGRPLERGRSVIVRHGSNGSMSDITPQPYNARTRVHEYGGGAFLVVDGVVYFSNFADQRLYRQNPGAEPVALTPVVDMRYADAVHDRGRQRLIAVREDHTVPDREAINTLVALSMEGDANGGQVIVAGGDFYSSPRLSPDGSRLSWLTWNHPRMPWDGTELWVGDIRPDGILGKTQLVAGGPHESIFQPEWSPNGILYFISDRTDWWNIYRWRHGRAESVCEMQAEFGEPQWVFGMRTYAFVSSERIICTYTQNGSWHMADLNTRSNVLAPIQSPFSEIHSIRVGKGRAVFIGASPEVPSSVAVMDLGSYHMDVLRRSNETAIDPAYVSQPESVEFPTENNVTAHGFYYAPKNRDFVAPATEKPPLLVKTHGGPTGATSAGFDLEIQYWTSHGFAVLDVNYGGSTGYGRAYRQRLNGQWGIVDVNDVVNGARYLVERGDVDGQRLAIDGGSAGGYTTLAVLTFRNVFRAGASYFGISDLESLAKDTHKFESRYLDTMIGPYPEQREKYRQRSPINFVERIECPIILFQGLEDRVVPPDQAERIYHAVRAKGLPVAYVPFEGEQHGFRRAENIKRSLDNEFYFYAAVFGFEPAEQIDFPKIDNRAAL